MADAVKTPESPMHRWKKNFPVLAEIGTSLVGAFTSDMIRDFVKETVAKPASESIKKTMRTQFPDWHRSMADEGLFSIMMEQLSDAEKKAIEGFLARKTNHKQRADFILSIAEQLTPVLPGIDPDSAEAREAWKVERTKAIAAAVSFLKYLANLADDRARERALLARNFMKRASEYPTTDEFLGNIRRYINMVDDSVIGRSLRARVRTRSRVVAARRDEFANNNMTWGEKFSFFSLTGRRPGRAMRPVVQQPPQPPALTVVQADNDTVVITGNSWQVNAAWILGITLMALLAATLVVVLFKQLTPYFHS